jgi:regulation of enolase protein 1 (concanavalin A-like superfamily)
VTADRPADGWRTAWGHRGWLNPPPQVVRDQDDLLVTAAEGSDFWRTTSYGFVHDTGHALLADFPDGTAAEVRAHWKPAHSLATADPDYA